MKTVAIIDYGMSNLRSVSRALEYVAAHQWQVQISDQAEIILNADKVVFPGQGAIGHCMQLLHATNLVEIIQQALITKPFLGICLGLQTLLTVSEENGGTVGFNWTPGEVKHFPTDLRTAQGDTLKIPHMGWNQVNCVQPEHPLWRDIANQSRFYFVHSYFVEPKQADVIAGETAYGIPFTSAVAKDNVFATQFHPEKSQQVGLTLLRNFLAWSP